MSNVVTVEIARLAYGGRGVAKLPSGKTVFVEGGCPGDKAEIEIVAEHARFDEARIARIEEESEHRVRPECPYSGVCGGCPWQTIDYGMQLEWKRRFVVDALSRIGGIEDAESLVAPCVASKKQWGYRNKVELVPAMAGNRLQLGFHGAGTDDIVPVDACKLLPKSHERAPKALAGALRYLKASDFGLLRVGVRVSKRTNNTQVALWTETGGFPRKAACDVLASAFKHTSLVRVLTKDDIKARKPSKVELLAGTEGWEERLYDNRMTVSAPSFFQVNTAGAESLIALVRDGLELTEDDIACDLYCGAGTFTLPLAEVVDLVFAVESAGSSVRDLRRNLMENGLDAEVIGGDAARESRDLGRVDKLVLDPPYSGMSEDVFESIELLAPSRIALVSCNPTTMARDLEGFACLGYSIERVTPVDLFPQTFHVESVVLMTRKP